MDIVYAFADTCVLADIVCQYNPLKPHSPFTEGDFLKKNMLKVLNRIVEDTEDSSGYVVTSTFAFVELINKFNGIFSGTKVTVERILGLLCEPPSWLIVEEINENTATCFCEIPNSVNGENVSSDDTIHVATAIQRGDEILFLTTDHILSQMNIPNITFINS